MPVSGNRTSALPPTPDAEVSITPQTKGTHCPGVTGHLYHNRFSGLTKNALISKAQGTWMSRTSSRTRMSTLEVGESEQERKAWTIWGARQAASVGKRVAKQQNQAVRRHLQEGKARRHRAKRAPQRVLLRKEGKKLGRRSSGQKSVFVSCWYFLRE